MRKPFASLLPATRLFLAFLFPTLAVTASAQSTTTYVYPLKVSANGRYLVDQNDVPWRVQADAAWFLSTSATPEQVDVYLATRKAQGFNSFYLMAMVPPGGYAAVPRAPDNDNGDPPFATPGLFSTAGASAASERYWAGIDSIIDKAAASGMAVMLAYTYLGYQGGGSGWYQTLLAQPSLQDCLDWGSWLGARYRGKSNLIWFALGDYTPPAGSEGEARALAIIAGIKSAGAEQLFMAEPSGGAAVPTLDAPAFASVLDMNSFYGYGLGHGEDYLEADRAWAVTPARPAWVQEGGYEYENNTGGFTGEPYETRRTRFWGVLGGGTAGDGFGSRDAYQMRDFPASLSTPGATYSTIAFQLFASLPWWDLRPSGTGAGYAGKDLIVAGGGTKYGMDYVTSAVTSDGQLLLAYIPTTGETTPRTLTVDMTAMSGATRARWFNPATGTFTDIGSAYDRTGTRSFTSPGDNGTGTNDWLLVLDAMPAPPPHALAVTKAGTGRGTVVSAPAGIDCGTICGATYAADAVVTLTATADAGSTFIGWSGACSGTGACQVALSTDQSVTAGFAPARAALVAAYGFDEGRGSRTADASGHGLTGTVVDAAWTTAGRYGGALSFGGRRSYVTLGNPAALQITGSMTWSAWIFATADPPRDGPIVAKSSGGGWRLETSRDTGVATFAIAVSPDGQGLTRRYSAALRGLNTWYHVAGVYDAAARTLDIYVNGVLSNGVLRGTVPARQYGWGSVTIGGSPSGSSFRGRIDEVRLYDHALTGDEIQAAMSTPVCTRGTAPAVPLRWHRRGF